MTELFTDVLRTLAPSNTGTFTQKRIAEVSTVGLFAAIHTPTQLEAVLIETSQHAADRITEWPQGTGFLVEVEPLHFDAGKCRIAIRLVEERYRDIFLVLANDVAAELVKQEHEVEAVVAASRRLRRWQEFLSKHGVDGLSDEARAGLFGELHLLEVLLLKHLCEMDAVSSWRGCHSANQDFQLHDFALEVKTTRSETPVAVHISNVEQLNDEGLSVLFLSVVHLHQSSSAGDTLPELVRRIGRSLREPTAELFREGLIELGYLDVHEANYGSDRYVVRSVLHHRVQPGFPRIVVDDVPAGVRGVKYQISLDACTGFRVENELVTEALARVGQEAGGG